jgi:hypothetical protein
VSLMIFLSYFQQVVAGLATAGTIYAESEGYYGVSAWFGGLAVFAALDVLLRAGKI